jgi:hypothetical protein
MEEFHQVRTNKHHERDLHIRIKEIHTHMRETELKEKEELKQCEEALKTGGRIEDSRGTIRKA